MLTLQEEVVDAPTLQCDAAPIPGEILAAIAAAAAVFVGKRFRIRAIEQAPGQQEKFSRWSRQGRMLVQSSHNLAVKHQQKPQ